MAVNVLIRINFLHTTVVLLTTFNIHNFYIQFLVHSDTCSISRIAAIADVCCNEKGYNTFQSFKASWLLRAPLVRPLKNSTPARTEYVFCTVGRRNSNSFPIPH